LSIWRLTSFFFLYLSFGGEEYLHIRKETHGKFSGKIEGEGGTHGSDNDSNHSQTPSQQHF
jgi:hypothetical protein